MADLLKGFAAATPSRAALVDESGTTTWAELDERVNRIINRLRALGLGAGDTFSLMSGNSRAWYEVSLAAQHAGMAVVPVNWHWTADELTYVLDNSDSKALFADSRFAEVATTAAAATPALVATVSLPPSGWAEAEGVAERIDGFTPYAEFLAAGDPTEPEGQLLGGPMFYTSGTTGRPKGVRNASLAAGLPTSIMQLMAAGFSQSMGVPSDGVTLLAGPAYHSAQWAFSTFPLLGGSTVVMRHKFDAAETLELIDRYAVTNIHLVPTQFVRMLKLPDDVKSAFHGDSLVLCLHGAAPCPPEVKRQMLAWWGPKVTEYYGGTEGGVASMVSGAEWLERPGTLGKPLAMMEVTIVGDDGEPCPPGVSGTIYMRNRMGSTFEYHKDAEKTQKAYREPGQFTLGDIGYLDADGYLFMSDRKIDMIISGGVNIYPAEIEGVLVEHPAVADAAVFGIPDEEFGEQVKAAVQLTDGAAASPELEAELIAFVRSRLAGYKAPRSIDFEVEFPRTATGKLYKRLLRDRYWAGTGRTI
jgi:long-chain acyl-CoA synthetase